MDKKLLDCDVLKNQQMKFLKMQKFLSVGKIAFL